MKNILIIGSGGREHALVDKIRQSPLLGRLYVTPGNGGINQDADYAPVNPDDFEQVAAFCKDRQIDLVVVGPEGPLVAGIKDYLEQRNIKVFGPSREAARLEGSKDFMKEMVVKFAIPTAAYASFDTAMQAKEYIHRQGAPIVIKTDGLAAGKGVTVAMTIPEAMEAVDLCFGGKFGSAGQKVVIEEFLEGEEVSFFAICDGTTAVYCGSAQDHKRVGDGDTGPNTGGMGTYSPAPILTPELEKNVMEQIIYPTVRGMAAIGAPFSGVLFAGLMIKDGKAKLLEYNIRFGDPECQVLMQRIKSDLLEIMLAAVEGKLENKTIELDNNHVLCVVMAARGYPEEYVKNTEIKGLDKAATTENVRIYHAGTRLEDGRILANGGRVLGITATSTNLRSARDSAYSAIGKINWPEGFCRKDIGWRALEYG